mmetsp:Transcript_12330/g.23663  ORF Transcript_12330/g.23663 Transcript_12330/m.23663 type:complete len:300 (-) Transcript_12330:740-1639(-)
MVPTVASRLMFVVSEEILFAMPKSINFSRPSARRKFAGFKSECTIRASWTVCTASSICCQNCCKSPMHIFTSSCSSRRLRSFSPSSMTIWIMNLSSSISASKTRMMCGCSANERSNATSFLHASNVEAEVAITLLIASRFPEGAFTSYTLELPPLPIVCTRTYVTPFTKNVFCGRQPLPSPVSPSSPASMGTVLKSDKSQLPVVPSSLPPSLLLSRASASLHCCGCCFCCCCCCAASVQHGERSSAVVSASKIGESPSGPSMTWLTLSPAPATASVLKHGSCASTLLSACQTAAPVQPS